MKKVRGGLSCVLAMFSSLCMKYWGPPIGGTLPPPGSDPGSYTLGALDGGS